MKTNLLLQRLNAGKKVFGVLREANETLTRRYRDVKSGVTVAQQWLKYAAAIFMFFTLAITNAWGADITLDNIGADLSATANTTMETTDITATGTTDVYTLNYYQCKKQGNAMLLTKSVSPFISNHTAIPGNINSVTLYINSGAAGKTTYDVAFSTAELTTATSGIGAVNITGGNSHTYDCNVSNARYFCITLGNANNGQVLKVVVNYTPSGGGSTYTVTYDGNDKTSGTVPTDGTAYSSGATVTVASNSGSLAKTGYGNLTHWNTTNSGSGTDYAIGSGSFSITSNTTLYAKWTATITLNGNGATTAGSPSATVNYNSSTISAINNPGKTDYVFAGWYSGSGGTGDLVIDASGTLQANVTGFTGAGGIWTATEDKTLYAKWNAPVNYELVTDASELQSGNEIVILDANGATALSTTQNQNNRSSTNTGFSLNGAKTIVTVTGSNVEIITLNASSTNWELVTHESQYLYTVSGQNYLRSRAANEDATGVWTITIDGETGVATILCSSTSRSLKKNSSSALYATYASGQTAVKIYKKVVPCNEPGTALSISSASTATVGTNLSLTSTGGNGGSVVWSVVNGTGSATVSGSTLIPASAGTVTVKAHQNLNGTTCAQDAEQTVTISSTPATITLNNYSGSATTTGYYEGDDFTLPSENSYTCGTKTFVGWSTVEVSTTNTKPTSNYYEPGASVTLGATNTFYAVFATVTGTINEYRKGTTADLTDGQIVIIVNTAANKAFKADNTFRSGYDVTPSNNKFTTSETTILWTIETGNGGYAFKYGSEYLTLLTSGPWIQLQESPADYFTANGSGPYVITSGINTGKSLEYYNGAFTGFNTSSGDAFNMDFYVPNWSCANYSTTCCTPPATALSITNANTVTLGNTLSLTTTGGNGETIIWSVVDGTGSATITGSTLTPVSAGTVTVTATQADGATYCGAVITQTITIAAAPCTADPIIGDPMIPTSFTLTSLTGAVSVNGSVDEGTGCSWADMGLVWGATANPTVSNNKKAIAGDHVKSFANNIQPTGSTTPTAWVVGTTYYVRIYGQNSKDGATYHYSTNDASFTLRSIDFEENGGSTVNMIYCNDGGVATKPADPTKAGHSFDGWYKESTLENAVDWANDEITANKTYYAKWTPLTAYSVTLEDDGSVLTQAAWGESVILPERAGCEGSAFAGWTKSWVAAQTTWTTTAPTIIPAGEYTPEANENLYPVYTKSEGGSAPTPGSITLTHADFSASYNTSEKTLTKNGYTIGYAQVQYNANGTPNNDGAGNSYPWCKQQLIQQRCTLSVNGIYNKTAMTINSVVLYVAGPTTNTWKVYQGTSASPTTTEVTGSVGSAGSLSYTMYDSGSKTCTGTATTAETPYTYAITSGNSYFNIMPNSKAVYFSRIVINYTEPGTPPTTSYISVPECTIFGPGRTVFIQSGNGVNGSAWNDASCVKAWFNNDGAGGLAQTTYWLFDALAPDAGKKLFATIIPTDVEVNQVTLQRFAPNCTDFWNNNGTLTGSSATSNTFRTECAGNDCVAWNATGVTMNLYGDPNSWASSLAPVMDHGNGVWLATYNNYAPTVTSAEFKIKTNYNGDIGDTGSNNNATLSDMIVGSTYNVTATFDITDHSLVMSKEFVKGTVHFDMQGHGSQIADLTNVTANSKIAPPTAPTATDYLFRGWFKEAACINEWDFANDVVTETMTLYAKWTPDKFTVTWMVSGNTFDTNTDVPYGTTVTAPSPAPTTSDCDGTKEFVGWTAAAYEHATTAPNDVFTSTSPEITENTTFYAVFAMANGTKTYEFEITTEDFNSTSYAANNTEKTSVATATDGTGGQMNVRWVSNQVMKNSGMQWQKDNGYIYNMTNLGTVNTVTITSTDGTYTTFYGTTQNPSSGAQGSGKGFFKTKIGGAAGHSSSVLVNFTAPYYIGYSTTCVAPTKCITPMFDPGAGTYSTAQNVSILSTAGATIYYTTDGSEPTTSSSVYSTPISVTADMTIKALAVKAGLDNSDVATAVYHIRCAMPTFTPTPGTYTHPLSVVDGNGDVPGNGVTISCTTPGVTIHITVDGSEPTTSSPVYEGAIDVPETMVIKAIAVKDGMASSEVAIGKYIIADCDWYESFASCSGSGGNDGTWSGISGSGGVVSDHSGWTIDNGAYGGNQCVKAGTSSKTGTITTPNIPVTNDIQYKLTFNVAPWDNGTAKFDLVSGAELLDGTTTWTAAANMTALDWNKYEVYIHTTSTEVIIKFYSTGKRFWLNDVCLKGLGNVKYHVTYEGNGSTGGTVPTDATEYANDAEVTVLGNTGSLVKEGYTFAGWNTAADGSGTTYTAGNKFHILHDMTLYAKWTICDYTINWQVNGASWTEGSPATSATYGTQPTSIPTAPTSGNCDGSKVFIGWSATSITGTTSTRPKDLFTSKYAAPFITANTTFYAVFATPTGVPTQFDLYSGALTEGDYLITYNDKSMKAAVTTNRLNYEDVTVTDNKVSNNEPTLVWYLYQDGGYWRIYNTTAGYAASTNVKNQAVITLDGTSNNAKWTDSVSTPEPGLTSYDFKNLARSTSSSNPNNKLLRENGTYGFACYAKATGGSLTLYKRNATYADYATTCTAPVHPYLVAEPTMLDFGNVAVGASVPAQTVTLSGDNLENVTITVTAPAGFTVSPTTISVTNGTLAPTTITVTPITTTAGTFNGNLVITYTDSDPTESITINIPLILKVSPLYTVTLHDLNTDEGTEQISTLKQTTPGSAVILPTTSPSSVCMINGWVFAGWVEGSALSATSVKPTLKLAEAYVPESDINLYAVYMHRSACTTTTDNIIQSTTGAADNDTYVEWDDIAVTSAARYSGSTAGGNGGIQFRSTDESGIITRTTGGVASQISIEWNAATVKGRTLQIYGKKTPYGTTSELYDPANRGILLGTVTKGTNITTDVLTIDADFEYIGIRSKEDLAYASTISIVWSNNCTRTWDSNPSCNPCTAKPTLNAATVASYATTTATVNCSGITDITGVGGTSGCVITSYGYCWGISETPNLTDNSYEVGTTYTTVNTAFGEYTITGLTPGVKYCVRPYATNGLGTAYGAAECFTTTLVDHISFEVPNGVDAPQAVTLGEALPYADVPQDCGNCWVFVGWTLESTWDAATLPSPLYKAGYSATSQGLSGTHKLYAVYKRDFYRMLTYPSELALDDGGAQTAFDDNYYVLTIRITISTASNESSPNPSLNNGSSSLMSSALLSIS